MLKIIWFKHCVGAQNLSYYDHWWPI